MSFMHNAGAALLLTAFALPGRRPAQAPKEEAKLSVAGDVTTPLHLSASDLKGMTRASVEASEEGGVKKYESVWLYDVLAKAGAPVGESLRGKALATYVLATARDGYQVVFSLSELDPVFRDNPVLLADQADGEPLFPYQGPFRLVVPGDKRGARSIRMLERIEVVRLRK
jgi:DMSO/TMAO reductase YedYZ molybdopterin-dependent catalytic subunit